MNLGLLFCMLFDFFVVFCCLLFVVVNRHTDEELGDSAGRSPIGWVFRVILFICMFFALFVVAGLGGFHWYLAFTNQTTYEMIKPTLTERYIEDTKTMIKDQHEYKKSKSQRKNTINSNNNNSNNIQNQNQNQMKNSTNSSNQADPNNITNTNDNNTSNNGGKNDGNSVNNNNPLASIMDPTSLECENTTATTTTTTTTTHNGINTNVTGIVEDTKTQSVQSIPHKPGSVQYLQQRAARINSDSETKDNNNNNNNSNNDNSDDGGGSDDYYTSDSSIEDFGMRKPGHRPARPGYRNRNKNRNRSRRRRGYRIRNRYEMYFSKGICANILAFFGADLDEDWCYPRPCIMVSK